MAGVYELAYEASQVREQFAQIHEQVFGLRRTLPLPGFRKQQDYPDLAQRLADLRSRLEGIQRTADGLSPQNLAKRGEMQLQQALLPYVHALAESVSSLETICRHLGHERQGVPGYSSYSSGDLRRDKIVYDGSIQHYRRRGATLQQLFDKF